jgi:II/X family phage/plasmid replication protein
MELKRRSLERGRAWGYDTPTVLLGERIKALDLPENIPLKTVDQVEGLSPRLVLAYRSWLQGEDLRALLPKNTFYRYRTELLKHGIDLSTPPRKAEVSNVIPLWRYLVAEPVGVPEWAKGTPLYFDPSQYLKADAL